MATNFDLNSVETSGGVKPISINTPGDIRTRINEISDIESIPYPFVGMIFYVVSQEKLYIVKSLKGKQNGPMVIEDILVDEYEELLSSGGSGTVGPTGPMGPTGPIGPTGTVEIWTGTQSQYDAITNKDSNTIYIITQ